ncbi:MAG: NUDIX hydrolase [Thiobacillaceae bacterium]
MAEIWKPNVVVAALVQQEGRFLLVEEETTQGVRLNQPAGHWEEYETLLEAVRREALEETAYHFEPAALLGIYRWKPPGKDCTYLRFAFTGVLTGHEPDRLLDAGIIRPLWLSLEEIRATQARHRSPLVLRCVEDYVAGKFYPLDVLCHFD